MHFGVGVGFFVGEPMMSPQNPTPTLNIIGFRPALRRFAGQAKACLLGVVDYYLQTKCDVAD
jgi:hypothetical protein